MMNLDTPLDQVAHFLPQEVAERLLAVGDAQVELAVLSEVRFTISKWEQSGVDMDPITFAKVLGPVVDMLIIANMAIRDLLNLEET